MSYIVLGSDPLLLLPYDSFEKEIVLLKYFNVNALNTSCSYNSIELDQIALHLNNVKMIEFCVNVNFLKNLGRGKT